MDDKHHDSIRGRFTGGDQEITKSEEVKNYFFQNLLPMSSGEEQLKRIQDKLQQLLKQYAVVQKENQKLKEELEKVGRNMSQHEGSIDDLKQQVSILKLSAGEMNEADKKEFEKRINVYLKEIDRCIAMIGA